MNRPACLEANNYLLVHLWELIFYHICNIKHGCKYPSQYIFNAKNFNPHKKPIPLFNMATCTQGMQWTWLPVVSTTFVTVSYSMPPWKLGDKEQISAAVKSTSYEEFSTDDTSQPLTHWGRDKMAAIFQTTVSNSFSWMKTHEIWLKFDWSLFLMVRLTISQHLFR